MEQTTNYDQFKLVTSNREIDKNHLKSLIKNIKENNLLHVNPIVVNELMQIIDGQHRLEAARILQVPIYYIIGEVNEKDIASLNKCKKNWSPMDYINYWAIKKRPGFHQLAKVLSENRNIPLSTALALLSSTGTRELDRIRNGEIDTLNYPNAIKIVQALKDLHEQYDFVMERAFVVALRKSFDHELFEFDHLQQNLKDGLSRRFVKCYTIFEYLQMIQEIYNYRMMPKNHLILTK